MSLTQSDRTFGICCSSGRRSGISRPEHAALWKPNVDALVVSSAILSQIQNGYSLDALKDWVRGMKSTVR